MIRSCVICFCEIDSKIRDRRAKTCSEECSKALKEKTKKECDEKYSEKLKEERKLNSVIELKDCVVCKKEFDPKTITKNGNAKTCSDECSKKLQIERSKEPKKKYREKQKEKRKSNKKIKFCIVCFSTFDAKTKGPNSKTCSAKCAKENQNRKRRENFNLKSKTCLICNSLIDFRERGGQAKACSDKCSKILEKQHKKEYSKENKEKIKKYNDRYHKENKEAIREYNLTHFLACKICKNPTPTHTSKYCEKCSKKPIFEKFGHNIKCDSAIEYHFLEKFLENDKTAKIQRAERLFKIYYFDPYKNKKRRYEPDFFIQIMRDNKIINILVEIKDDKVTKRSSSWGEIYLREAELKKPILISFCKEQNIVPLWFVRSDLYKSIEKITENAINSAKGRHAYNN